MHQSVIEYCKKVVQSNMIENKFVIELGSRDVGGSFQTQIKKMNPLKFIGIDIEPGIGVDLVAHGENLLEYFEPNSVDFILTNECMEHVEDWVKIVENFKTIISPNGYILITTRSKGFAYHAWPYDFWRYEMEDMKLIFDDFKIISIEKDPETPGIFLLAKKKENYTRNTLNNIKLYSIVKWKRLHKLSTNDITQFDIHKNIIFYNLRFKLANIFSQKLKHTIKNYLYKTKR